MEKTNSELIKELTDFKDKVKLEAEKLVVDHFPRKILELNILLQSERFSKTQLDDVHVDLNVPVPDSIANHHDETIQTKKRKFDALESAVQGTRVLALPYGMVPCNKHILQLIDVMKPNIRQLIEDANMVKMWIQFLIPRIEDGNNFGVSIQEDTLAEVRQVESEAAAFLDQISRYFITRGKIVSKVAKYPHVEDYRRTISELDEKEYISLRLVCCELRNHYSSLHDLITKNMEKIKKPRSSNAESMY